jgi:hypothetical protein
MELLVFVIAVIATAVFGLWRVHAGDNAGPDPDRPKRPYDLRNKNYGQHTATEIGFPDDGSPDLGTGKR